MREVDLRGVAAEVGLGGSAGTESANGEEVIIRGCEVEDLLAFDERLLDDGVDAEGVAVEDNEVGVFAGFERADALLSVRALSAPSRVMPPRTARAAVRRKKRESVM